MPPKVATGVLGVAAGEGVARGLSPGAFHNGEVGVPDPGPGNPEQQLQKLVHHRAEKAHQQQIVPLLALLTHQKIRMAATMKTVSSPRWVTAENTASQNGVPHALQRI